MYKRQIQRRTAFSELCQKVHCFSEVQLAGGVTRAQFLFAVMQPSLHRDFMYTVHTQRCTVVSEVYSEVYVLLFQSYTQRCTAVSDVHSQVYCCYYSEVFLPFQMYTHRCTAAVLRGVLLFQRYTHRCTAVSGLYSEVYCRFRGTLTGVQLLYSEMYKRFRAILRGALFLSEVRLAGGVTAAQQLHAVPVPVHRDAALATPRLYVHRAHPLPGHRVQTHLHPYITGTQGRTPPPPPHPHHQPYISGT